MSNGLLLFHLGWTDIINCLPLVSYFQSKYKKLFVLYKQQTAELFQYYCGQYNNIVLLELPNDLGEEEKTVPMLLDMLKSHEQMNIQDFNIHGVYDKYRTDSYKDAFSNDSTQYFSTKFYTSYGIPHRFRVDFFSLPKNVDKELALVHSIRKSDDPYILIHDTPDCKINAPDGDYDTVQLHGITPRFFDALLLLQFAKEIHLIDSVWAAVCYSIDARYGYLSHIPITVYSFRGHQDMFSKPIALPNWKIVNCSGP
jgi:hypothetical protein